MVRCLTVFNSMRVIVVENVPATATFTVFVICACSNVTKQMVEISSKSFLISLVVYFRCQISKMYERIPNVFYLLFYIGITFEQDTRPPNPFCLFVYVSLKRCKFLRTG